MVMAGSLSMGQNNPVFISPEIMVGKIVANYDGFPGSEAKRTLILNMGTYLNNPNNHTHRYYNLPHVGVAMAFSDLGNQENLGEEISLVPYIMLNTSKRMKHSWSIKVGLGASYFTNFYDEEINPNNQAIGSAVNFTFLAYLYHSLIVGERFNIQFGGGFWHSSNSHTQLPNYGLNAAMLSVAFNYYMTKIDPDINLTEMPDRFPTQKFLQVRGGLGMHEFGSSIGPIGGDKMPVATLSVDYGYLFNQQLKFYGGLFYRYYSSYHKYLEENGTTNDGLIWEASNINFHLGLEYLLGHVGMNIEGGINLYKPFYDDFYDLHENGDAFNEFRMSTFNTRIGMNLYLKNTSSNPKSNLAIGTHINANFGKADFGELSLVYMRRIK
jgi:hypothetical protein